MTKTARIESYEMHGTRSGKAARVSYRGVVLYEISGNQPAMYLIGRAVQFAAVNGFHRARINDKPLARIASASVGEGFKKLGLTKGRGLVFGIAAPEDETTTGCTVFRRSA